MKSYEVDGRDYFFVSRQTMENFIQKKKFIEFGEYRGYLYGTSKDSIKRAMKSGKTCVLKVQPEVRQSFIVVIDKNKLVQVLCYNASFWYSLILLCWSSLHDYWENCFAGDVAVKNSRVQAILCICKTPFTEGAPLIKIDSTAKRQISFS